MKIYVTKYALTKDILELDNAEPCKGWRWEDTVLVPNETRTSSTVFHSGHWWKTLEEAKAKAEDMRRRKIEHLKAQVARLEKLDFGKVAP